MATKQQRIEADLTYDRTKFRWKAIGNLLIGFQMGDDLWVTKATTSVERKLFCIEQVVQDDDIIWRFIVHRMQVVFTKLTP